VLFWCEHLDQEQDFWHTCYPEEVEEEATKIFLCWLLVCSQAPCTRSLESPLSRLCKLGFGKFWGVNTALLHVGAPLKRMITELVSSVELLDGYSDQRDWRENVYQGRQQLWTSCKHGQQPLSTIHLLLQCKKLVKVIHPRPASKWACSPAAAASSVFTKLGSPIKKRKGKNRSRDRSG
jgi:hypothetical protein